MNKVFLRGIIAQSWYNFTEALVYGLTYRKTPAGIQYHKKIHYGTDKLQYINIYFHKDNKKYPLMIYIHGGSWVSGITEMRNSYISQWAKAGFNTASISYSYAPQKLFPEQIKEVVTAIDFICDNAEKYNFDISNVLLAGESAGGYFISYVASVLGNRKILDDLGIEFRHADDIKVNALLSISGCFDLRRLSDKLKPQSEFPDLKTMITSYTGLQYDQAIKILNSDHGCIYSPQVNSSYPPAFLIWADKDLLRFESFDFSEELQKNNVEYCLYKADGVIGMHAWAIVMLFKKSRICFDSAKKYILPLFDEYFNESKKKDNT